MIETKYDFYLTGRETWQNMLAEIKSARFSIDLEQYIFSNDNTSRQFIEVLIGRAKTGVKIRMLCDTVGSWYFYNSPIMRNAVEAGIEIRFFNIVSPWQIGSISNWFFRDHRKILVVDDLVGFTGGIGILDEMENWRDTNVKVSGPIVGEMRLAFEEMWEQSVNNDLISRIKKSAHLHRGSDFLTNAPYWKKHFLYKNIIAAIRGANSYIYLTTPYFVPTAKFRKALEKAKKRGVDVRILVPNSVNEIFVQRASQSHYEELLRSGVKIYHYTGRGSEFLHAKTGAIDDRWATVGSFNLDSLSFLFNYEANIVSTEKTFVETIKNHFLEDIKFAKEITLSEWQQRSFLNKILETIVTPFRRFL